MLYPLIMLAIQISQQQPYITYASADEIRFDYFVTGFFCYSGRKFTKVIDYNGGTFENTPQIIYSAYTYNYYIGAAVEFTFQIPNKNTTHFEVQITCRYPGTFNWIRFTWIAFDNPNIQVIDVFNVTMENQMSQIYQFPISNPAFTQGFISLISFGFDGPLNFNFTIINIASDHVNVQFDTTTTHLMQVGYQVILGTQEAFTMTPIIDIAAYTNNATTASYKTDYLPIPSNSILILPFVGVNFKCDIRIKQFRGVYFQNSTHIRYDYTSSDSAYLDYYASVVWINKLTHYTPFFCYKMRISKTYNPYTAQLPKIILSISEIALLYDSIQSQNVVIHKSKKSLILTVAISCNIGQQVTGTVYKVQKNVTFTQKCFKSINYLTYNIELHQNDSIYQTFEVNVTTSGISVTQTVLNLPREIYTLANINVIG